ncbi:MAG: anti-sigma factor family protein [Trebonia sp.]
MNCPMMVSLGVYVLGATDAAERRRLEAHVPGCQQCTAELRRLAPLPGLLAGIPESIRKAAPSPGRPAAPARRARARRGTVARWAAVATAGLAAAAGVGLWLSSGAEGRQPAALTVSGADPATHVSATAALTATSWGTSIVLQVNGLPENVECRLVIRSLSGQAEVSGVWDAWAKGPASIPASASWLPSDIGSLQVTTSDESLVTLIVSHPATGAGRAVTP